jgi:hypothetical protein
MAPAQSKLATPLITQPKITAQRKRKASSKITDENFVGAESNAVTKRLKLSADAARAAVKHRQRQPSVEDAEDEDSRSVNSSPKNPDAILEAADGSDDVEMLDNDAAPALRDFEEDDDDEDEPEVTKPVETAEEQRSELNKSR